MYRYFPLSALLALACWNPFCPEMAEGGEYPAPLSPEILFYNLERSYVARDLEAYTSCFVDTFKFYFDPGEEGIEELLRDQWGLDSLVWGLAEERLSAKNLFEHAYFIDLTLWGKTRLLAWGNGSSTEVWMCYYTLTVDAPPPVGQSTAEGRARFTVVQDKEGLWHIAKWEDFKL